MESLPFFSEDVDLDDDVATGSKSGGSGLLEKVKKMTSRQAAGLVTSAISKSGKDGDHLQVTDATTEDGHSGSEA